MNRVREIVAGVLGVPPSEILTGSGPADFAQWDSAAHIDIMLSLEAAYGVSFTARELAETLSIAGMEDALRQKGVRLG